MFVLSFKNGNNDPVRNSCDKYYMPLVENKNFNALTYNNPIFWSASKNQWKSVWKTFRNVNK